MRKHFSLFSIMEYLIINIVPQETLTLLNEKYDLRLCRAIVKGDLPTPKIRTFDKMKRFMESNREVHYDKVTY